MQQSLSELGDKTFFITAILAMRYSRRFVLMGSICALAAMTILSVLLGQAVSLLHNFYVHWAEALLFFGFGLKLLNDARKISAKPNLAEQKEALEAVEAAESSPRFNWQGGLAVIAKAFGLTFIAEWGDRTQFTTIALAAANHPVGVTMGAISGHAVCAAIAVVCGRMVCGRISERTITMIGGVLFLIFAMVGFSKVAGLT
jgi:putative Ca2+/H+ antiporter (TMEM165/GDT1 family)